MKFNSETNVALNSEFDMKDLDKVKIILAVEIKRDISKSLIFSNQTHVSKVLRKFGMHKCEPITLFLENHFRVE